jgi:hypothetical protein
MLAEYMHCTCILQVRSDFLWRLQGIGACPQQRLDDYADPGSRDGRGTRRNAFSIE